MIANDGCRWKISQTAGNTVKSIDQRWGISAGAASFGAFVRQASIDLWNKVTILPFFFLVFRRTFSSVYFPAANP
jgi:hypothetical protein